jgi:hypothetical protein
MIGMEIKLNGIECKEVKDENGLDMLQFTAYNNKQGDPLFNKAGKLDTMWLLEELYQNCCILHKFDTNNYAYLEDEHNYRYYIIKEQYNDKVIEDFERLLTGEVKYLNYYRDTEFLRVSDIFDLIEENKNLFTVEIDTKYYNCNLLTIDQNCGQLIFRTEEGKNISVDFEETEQIKHQEEWV